MLGERHLAPRIPDGQCVYAVGDIHGRLDLLDQLLDRIWADAPHGANTLVLVGDYIDRGPDSKGVVERLMALERPGWQIVKLRGNHEHFLLEYLANPEVFQAWRTFGGAETMLSYGVRPPVFTDRKELERAHAAFTAQLPHSHLTFFNMLPYSHTIGGFFFVHAGVRPGIALARQSPEDMMWIREEFLLSSERLEKVVVHGHTPTDGPVLRPNRIGVDTGAYATGILTAAKLTGESCTFLSTGSA